MDGLKRDLTALLLFVLTGTIGLLWPMAHPKSHAYRHSWVSSTWCPETATLCPLRFWEMQAQGKGISILGKHQPWNWGAGQELPPLSASPEVECQGTLAVSWCAAEAMAYPRLWSILPWTVLSFFSFFYNFSCHMESLHALKKICIFTLTVDLLIEKLLCTCTHVYVCTCPRIRVHVDTCTRVHMSTRTCTRVQN